MSSKTSPNFQKRNTGRGKINSLQQQHSVNRGTFAHKCIPFHVCVFSFSSSSLTENVKQARKDTFPSFLFHKKKKSKHTGKKNTFFLFPSFFT